MSFIELGLGPWRGVAFLQGHASPGDAPAGCSALAWRHDGTARLGGVLEQAQVQVLVRADAVPGGDQLAQPEAFGLRSVTTASAGEAYVFAGRMFGRSGEVETAEPCVAAQLTLAPETELAVVVDEEFAYAVVAVDGELDVNTTPVPARSVGLIDAGHRTLGLTNRSDRAVHLLLLGGQWA